MHGLQTVALVAFISSKMNIKLLVVTYLSRSLQGKESVSLRQYNNIQVGRVRNSYLYLLLKVLLQLIYFCSNTLHRRLELG